MDRRALLLSRLQLAFTVSFHILPEKDVRFIVIEQLCLIRPLSLTPAGRCYLGPVPRRAPAGSHTALRPAKFNPVLRHDRRRLGDRTQARYGLAAKSVIEDLIRSGQSIHPPQAGHRIKWSACPSADRRAACRDICRAGERDVSRNCSAHSPAAQLIGLMPDVILAGSTINLAVIVQATSTVPVVFVQVADPVAQGFVASMKQPGGNVTGFSLFEFSLGGKWLYLLKEIAPALAQVALCSTPTRLPIPNSSCR